jgi:hypothetical protein
MREIYKFLAQYNLDKTDKVQSELMKMSSRRIERFTQRYINLAKRRLLPAKSQMGMTDIYPDSSGVRIPVELIEQFSIYARKIYIHDPLLQLSVEWNEGGFRSPYMYMNSQEKLNTFKRSIHNSIQYLLYLRPLVEADIVFLTTMAVSAPNIEGTI